MINGHQKRNSPLLEIAVTRQPIFDRKKYVFAYELFFQSGLDIQRENGAMTTDSVSTGIDSLFLTSILKLTGGKLGFITFNREMLLHQIPLMFPCDLVGVELQEDVDPGKNLTRVIEKIKTAGYLLVVNDWLYNAGDISLVGMADIIGVDFRSRGIQKRSSFFKDDYMKPRFLAKSVETATDFDWAANLGYHYFQGNFFSKPNIVSIRNIPSYKINFMRILKEINKPSVQFDQVESILKHDISITYKLLRFVNSAGFGLRTAVQSIRHALTFLGELEVRKWLSFIVLSGVGADKPHELIINTLIRARFCESLALACHIKKDMQNYFLMGMFSMVDAFLDRPMSEILEELPLIPEVKSALLGNPNSYRDILDLVIDYENANWRNILQAAKGLQLDVREISDLYMESVEWGKYL